jgi:tetratricopeptide (TPR) repeat protein
MIDLGNIHRWQGDYAAAWEQYREALELAQSKQAAYYVCDIWCDMTHLHLLEHQPDQALSTLRQAIEKALQLGTEPYLAKTLLAVVNYLYYTGEDEQAAQWFGVVRQYVAHVDVRLFNTIKAKFAIKDMPDTPLPLVEIIQNAQAMLG